MRANTLTLFFFAFALTPTLTPAGFPLPRCRRCFVGLLYSSQEVGQDANLPFFTRTPIDWSANPSMQQQYEKLFAVYNSSAAFTTGTLTSYPHNDIAAFKRKNGSDEYLVLVNTRNTTIPYTLDATVQNTTWTNSLTNTPVTLTTTAALTPYQYLILKK